jgi:hypothetical protein
MLRQVEGDACVGDEDLGYRRWESRYPALGLGSRDRDVGEDIMVRRNTQSRGYVCCDLVLRKSPRSYSDFLCASGHSTRKPRLPCIAAEYALAVSFMIALLVTSIFRTTCWAHALLKATTVSLLLVKRSFRFNKLLNRVSLYLSGSISQVAHLLYPHPHHHQLCAFAHTSSRDSDGHHIDAQRTVF